MKKYSSFQSLNKAKILLKILNYTDRELELVISSKYALLMYARKNDVKTLKK